MIDPLKSILRHWSLNSVLFMAVWGGCQSHLRKVEKHLICGRKTLMRLAKTSIPCLGFNLASIISRLFSKIFRNLIFHQKHAWWEFGAIYLWFSIANECLFLKCLPFLVGKEMKVGWTDLRRDRHRQANSDKIDTDKTYCNKLTLAILSKTYN